MKNRIISTVLSFIFLFSTFVASASATTTTASASLASVSTIQDIIAGVNATDSLLRDGLLGSNIIPYLSKISSDSARAVSDGIYYLNNRGEGKFLKKLTSTSVNSTFGFLSDLPETVKWTIAHYDSTYCTIQSSTDTTKYLAGGVTTESSLASLLTVSSSIPDRCLWEITIATGGGGGCVVKNKYSGCVLYCTNGVIYTVPENGAEYDNKVWRIASDTYYTTEKELSDATFSSLSVGVGESTTPIVSGTTPRKAFWATESDFTYSSSSNKLTINNNFHTVTGQAPGNTVVTAIHKVTGLSKTFTVTVADFRFFQSSALPGLEANSSTNIARDMKYSDLSKTELATINSNLSSLATEYDLPPASSSVLPPQGPEALIKYMKQLPDLFAAGDASMCSVVNSMVNQFLSGSGNDFTHATLTSAVRNHASTIAYVSATKQLLTSKLTSNGGNLSYLDSDTLFQSAMSSVPLPAYNTASDYSNGLKIALNGLWGCYMEITDFSVVGNTYTGTIKYTFYDHFGLDEGDITNSSIASEFLGYTAQFGSWFVLQRYENCNGQYKPFITYITFEESFNGSIS